uniref:Uncharacterized protein n=1 Tax=Marmota marmota marmota TaxID=9994 RepID=A0A8C6EQH9_MARMA
MPTIPAIQEAKAGGSQVTGQPGKLSETLSQNKIKSSVVEIKNIHLSWVWWHTPVIPVTRKAEYALGPIREKT